MKLFFLSFFSSVLFLANAQNGTPDPNFADNGTATLDLCYEGSGANCILFQPDGKIIVGGSNYHVWFNYTAVLARFLPNGDLDSSFGVNGIINPYIYPEWQIYDLARQADGKILAAGVIGTYNFGVFRFLENGDLDSTFGVNGLFSFVPLGYLEDGAAKSLAIQADGKIVVCGDRFFNTSAVVVRLTADGQRDSTFSNDGVQELEFQFLNTGAQSLLLQPNGKIVIAGTVGMNGSSELMLFRLDNNGGFDYTFGQKGIVYPTPRFCENPKKVLLQSGGKIVVVGNDGESPNSVVVSRFSPNGSLDASFGQGGLRTISVASHIQTVAHDADLAPDESILIAGRAHSSGKQQMTTRLFANGTTDYTFGQNGFVLSNDTAQTYSNAIKVRGSGQFFTAGLRMGGCSGYNISKPFLSAWHFQNSIGQEEFTQNEFKIYPNPSSGTFTISTKNPGTFALHNSLGQQVWQGRVNSEPLTLNLDHLPAGLYFLVDEGGASQKIILSN